MYRNIRQFNLNPPVKISYRIINDSAMDEIYESFSRDNFGNFIEFIEYNIQVYIHIYIYIYTYIYTYVYIFNNIHQIYYNYYNKCICIILISTNQ